MKRDYLTVVTGHPRTGTSMMMAMLHAGGMPVLVDNLKYPPDACNPRGYYQHALGEAMADGEPENAWAWEHLGEAVKILGYRVDLLPADLPCRLIVMERELVSTAKSYIREFLLHADHQIPLPPPVNPEDPGVVATAMGIVAVGINKGVQRLVTCWSGPHRKVLVVSYEDVVERPRTWAMRIDEFLCEVGSNGNPIRRPDPFFHLDIEAMVAEQQAGMPPP